MRYTLTLPNFLKKRSSSLSLALLCVLIAVFAFSLTSCHKDHDDPPAPTYKKEKTIFVYMPWTGSQSNLYSYFKKNIEDMKKGVVKQGGLKQVNLVIYIASLRNKAHLIKVSYEKGKCTNDTIATYNDGAMETADKLSRLLNKVKSVAPAPIYDMIIGSHGVGWIYADEAPRYMRNKIVAARRNNLLKGLPITRQTRYFGGTDIEMDITELAEGIARSDMQHLQFLLFDDCNMANIETVYDLKDVTDYLIACPTEIMGHGMPYYEMWQDLSTTSPNYKGMVDNFYQFYSNYKIGTEEYHYGTISVADCRQANAMVELLCTIHADYPLTTEMKTEQVQVLDGYAPPMFYDFSDYIHQLCKNPTLIARYDEMMKLLVPYEAHTEKYYSALVNNGVHYMRTCCGLTISAPSHNEMVKRSKATSCFYRNFQ